LLPLLLLALFADPPADCSISGTVVDSVTGEGLAKVEVTLLPFDRLEHPASVTSTDAAGRFSITELACAPYRLMGRRARYVEGRQIVLRLEPGERGSGLTYKMVRSGAAAGTVRDADGEPAAGVSVLLAQRVGVPGRTELRTLETTATDDQGNYRFGFLKPGSYYVVAEPRPRVWDAVGLSEVPVAPVRTFYPSAVALAAGAFVSGIDIQMSRSRTFRISGRVVDGGPRQLVMLRPETALANSDFVPNTITRGAEGEFQFRSTPPGAYLLETEGAAVPVMVAAADVEGVRVVAGAGSILGRVRVEGRDRRAVGRVRIEAGARVQYARIGEDGSFLARAVPPGTYRVEARLEDARNLYVKSVRAGQAELDSVTIFGDETVAIECVLAVGAQVAGGVTNEDGKPAAGATVVLVPAPELRGRGDLFRTAEADHAGRYTLDAVAPGDYTVFAWEDPEDGAWHDPEFLKAHDRRGERVTVAGTERRLVQVRLSPMIP
jgi:hypothetical protein